MRPPRPRRSVDSSPVVLTATYVGSVYSSTAYLLEFAHPNLTPLSRCDSPPTPIHHHLLILISQLPLNGRRHGAQMDVDATDNRNLQR